MNKFLNILLICISVAILSSCYMSGFSKAGKLDMSDPEYGELMPFGSDFEKALYKARLEVNGHEFAGLLMIKHFPDDSYKVAFFNELGMNFFDFELRNIQGKNRLNLYTRNIYDPLDKDMILNKFEKYFSMLLGPGPVDGIQKTYLSKERPMVMVMTDSYKGKDGYMSTNLFEPYKEIVNVGGLFKRDKITISIVSDKNKHCPEYILIEQPGFRLKFEMKLVE